MYCIWKCLQCLVSVWDHRLLSIWLEFSAKASVFRLIKNNNRFFSSEDVTILATIVDWGKTNSSLMCGWGCWPLLRDVPNGRTPFTDWASGIVSQYPVWLEAQPKHHIETSIPIPNLDLQHTQIGLLKVRESSSLSVRAQKVNGLNIWRCPARHSSNTEMGLSWKHCHKMWQVRPFWKLVTLKNIQLEKKKHSCWHFHQQYSCVDKKTTCLVFTETSSSTKTTYVRVCSKLVT